MGRRFKSIIVIGMLLAMLAACGPEAGRPLGGGPGADPGNHPVDFKPRSKVFPGESMP